MHDRVRWLCWVAGHMRPSPSESQALLHIDGMIRGAGRRDRADKLRGGRAAIVVDQPRVPTIGGGLGPTIGRAQAGTPF